MSKCDVCSMPGTPRYDVAGRLRGYACSTGCAVLMFFRWAQTRDERNFEAWCWRARRAEMRGEPFDKPAPSSAEEREWLMFLAARNERAA